MELRHLYMLSEMIHNKIEEKDFPKDMLEDMEITMVFDPVIFYGIDKEFYYMTHDNSYKGFEHSEVVEARVNGVRFKILPRPKEEKQEARIEMI